MNIYPVILPKKLNTKGKANIKIRVVHNRDVRDIATDFYILPKAWKSDGRVDPAIEPNADYINFELLKKRTEYEGKLLKINYSEQPISKIIEILRDVQKKPVTFTEFYLQIVSEKSKVNEKNGQIYAETLARIEKFSGKNRLTFTDIDETWLRKFRAELKSAGNKGGTIAMHLRNIRHVYNCAIDENHKLLAHYPFRRFKITDKPGEQVPMSVEQLRRLFSMRFEDTGKETARKAFLLSFLLIGINNSDMYNLTRGCIIGDRVFYIRNKTEAEYSIRLEPEISAYIESMKGVKNLLCLADIYANHGYMTRSCNKHLKKIGEVIGFRGLHFYTARHTWAYLCKNELQADDNEIAAALGHKLKGTVQTYTHRNIKLVDRLNRELIDFVFSTGIAPELELVPTNAGARNDKNKKPPSC